MSTPPLHSDQQIAKRSYWTMRGSHWTSRWCYGLSTGIGMYTFFTLERNSKVGHLFADGNNLATDVLLILAYVGALAVILWLNNLFERALERSEQRAGQTSGNSRIAYLVFLVVLTIGSMAMLLASPFRH